MFGRSKSTPKSDRKGVLPTPADSCEVDRLRDQVARLEAALADVIDASDGVLLDLRNYERELALMEATDTAEPVGGFGAAWIDFELEQPEVSDDFFADVRFDERSRRWLLAAK